MGDGREEAIKAFAMMAAKQAMKEQMKEATAEIAEQMKITYDAFRGAGFTDEQAFEMTSIILEVQATMYSASVE